MTKRKNATNVAIIGIFAALVIVLQFISGYINISGVTITLTLVPIVLGAVLYGPKVGAILGGFFGVSVCIQVVTGLAGALSTDMFTKSPVLTISICMIKGVLAGILPGIIFDLLKNKNRYLGVILAAISAPLANTAVFLFGLRVFFADIVRVYAHSQEVSAVYFVLVLVVGVNFLAEFCVNLIAAPGLYRVSEILKK